LLVSNGILGRRIIVFLAARAAQKLDSRCNHPQPAAFFTFFGFPLVVLQASFHKRR
jgi:hypothetical protein